MTTLSGRLGEGVLANLIQYFSLAHADGCLVVRHPKRLQGNIFFEGGRIVFIEARPLYDLAALSALLLWTDGTFGFRAGVKAPRNTLTTSTESLLLQAAQHGDERSGGARRELQADSVLSVVGIGQAANGRHGSRQPPLLGRPGSEIRLASEIGPGPELLPGSGSRRGSQSRPAAEAVPGPRAVASEVVPGHVTDLAAEQVTVKLSLTALHLWRKLDGERSLREIARSLGREVKDLVVAGSELLDAALAEYTSVAVADERFVRELMREAVDLLGPVGEIVVEDALYDLGLSADALPVDSVDELMSQLRSTFPAGSAREVFMFRAEELRRLFALDTSEGG